MHSYPTDMPQFSYLKLDKTQIAEIPSTNGVYIFAKGSAPVYIGKSVNLRARVRSHIENAKSDAKEQAIIENADRIGYMVTDSEFKALTLESRLIQKHKPPYNVRWRDDKSYLYIKITTSDPYPKVLFARRENDGTSRYFGPFTSFRVSESIVRLIRRVIPFCTQQKIGKRACFYAKIGQCDPCPNTIEQESDPVVKKKLKAQYRKQIRQVVRILEGDTEKIVADLYKDLDARSQAQEYEEAIDIRNQILRLERFFRGKSLDRDREEQYNQSELALDKLQSLLRRYFPDLSELHRIECYDVSNTRQKDATASMVVMHDGLTDKKAYRKFRIKNQAIQSDFEMMDEVLNRRFKNSWEAPDLLVVDGGKPQVRTAMKALAQSGNQQIPLIGIAKNPDRLVIGVPELPTLRPPYTHAGFNLIRAIRDESHRFARKYHIHLRSKKML